MSMERSNIRDKMRNPLLDAKEDISIRPFQHYSLLDKIGVVSALLLSIVILIISGFSFYIDLVVKPNYLYCFIDFLIFLFGLGAVYFVLNAFKRLIVSDLLIDTAFQEGVYSRLAPLVENIAEAHVDTDIMIDRISNIDMKIENLLKERYSRDIRSSDFLQEPIAVATSIKFAIKSIFLIVITMALFMFLVNFNLGNITPYAVLLIFIVWWVFITNEYNLWKESSAWIMVFFPILVIPVLVLLLGNLLNYNVLMATLYLSVGLYTFIYYVWAVYASTGSLPIIAAKKQVPEKSGFFASQQKGMLRELLGASISRIEQSLEKDQKKQESEYAWKK
jgi:hypothetical protein